MDQTVPPLSPQPVNKSGFPLLLIFGLIFAFAAGAGVMYGWQNYPDFELFKPFKSLIKPQTEKACTQEAKICPNGTTVGRTGPNCEFAACPSSEPTAGLAVPPQSEIPSDWKIFKNEKYQYEIKCPNDWVEIEHSSNFDYITTFKTSDGSWVQIMVVDSKGLTLDEYLADLDELNKTNYEGTPSTEVVESKDIIFNTYPARERQEHRLAAGFTTVVTYVAIDRKIFSFDIIHNSANFLGTEAYKNYYQILSTFRFLPEVSPSPEVIEGQFCGGFTGLPCPNGYQCQLEGSYPDAGGKCVKL